MESTMFSENIIHTTPEWANQQKFWPKKWPLGTPRAPQKCFWSNLRVEFLEEKNWFWNSVIQSNISVSQELILLCKTPDSSLKQVLFWKFYVSTDLRSFSMSKASLLSMPWCAQMSEIIGKEGFVYKWGNSFQVRLLISNSKRLHDVCVSVCPNLRTNG